MKKLQQENEQKFLMRSWFIAQSYESAVSIMQFYVPYKNKHKRVRFVFDTQDNLSRIEYIYKEKIKPGQNIEHHEPLELSEALDLVRNSVKSIQKSRLTYNVGDLKYELDVFKHVHLTIMEVETPEPDQEIIMPKNFADLVIANVTDVNGFSNFDLAFPDSHYGGNHFVPIFDMF
jgi:CYTH domain-containing protein